jgi:hypothetical protein
MLRSFQNDFGEAKRVFEHSSGSVTSIVEIAPSG